MPHAEVPGMCDLAKPCGYKDENGEEHNRALHCLARAAEAVAMHDPATARRAHALACKCDAAGGTFPAYNSTPFICDAAGKPAFIAADMKAAEAKDVVDCAICHPKRGAAACEREIARLKPTDAQLAAFVETDHLRRCRTPSQEAAVNSWNDWP